MKKLACVAALAVGCGGSTVAPTVHVEPTDTVVEMGLSEACDPATLGGWIAVDGAFLEDPETILVRVRHCDGSRVTACGAMAPEDIYPGWFDVTVGASSEAECAARVERVLRVDLSSARETTDPGLDRVDQRAIRPTEDGGAGPRNIPIWVMGD